MMRALIGVFLLVGCAAEFPMGEAACANDKCDEREDDDAPTVQCRTDVDPEELLACLVKANNGLAAAEGYGEELDLYRDLQGAFDHVVDLDGQEFHALDTTAVRVRLEQGALAMMSVPVEFDALLDGRVNMAPASCLEAFEVNIADSSEDELYWLQKLSVCVEDTATSHKDAFAAQMKSQFNASDSDAQLLFSTAAQQYLRHGWKLCEATSRRVGDDKFNSPRVEGCAVGVASVWHDQVTEWVKGER